MGLKGLSDAELSELVGIHCRLSPENLWADGERPRAEVFALNRKLRNQLEQARVRHNLTPQDVDECAVLDEEMRRQMARKQGAERV